MIQDITRTALTRFRTLVESHHHPILFHESTLKADRRLARLALKKCNKYLELNRGLKRSGQPDKESET
jgi:hypothetical protein